MKERPILFNGDMVRAILDGRKTQTRRVVKIRPGDYFATSRIEVGLVSAEIGNYYGFCSEDEDYKCPYGVPGDRLWVRETMWINGGYVATDNRNFPNEGKTPSIFMPRWASRVNLEVTGVRVERLQEISEIDAKAEGVRGIPKWESFTGLKCEEMGFQPHERRRASFGLLWNKINGKKHPWESNPWVWVIDFKQEDTLDN